MKINIFYKGQNYNLIKYIQTYWAPPTYQLNARDTEVDKNTVLPLTCSPSNIEARHGNNYMSLILTILVFYSLTETAT